MNNHGVRRRTIGEQLWPHDVELLEAEKPLVIPLPLCVEMGLKLGHHTCAQASITVKSGANVKVQCSLGRC